MLKKDVVLNRHYAIAHDSYQRLAVVHVLRESPYGGYEARKLRTGRTIRIKSAAKLRFPVEKRDGRWQMVTTDRERVLS